VDYFSCFTEVDNGTVLTNVGIYFP